MYVFMLGALIVFSGCIGTGTTNGEDDDVGTTVINNYYNNTTVDNNPEYTTSTVVRQPWGDSGINIYHGATILTINQSAGEGIIMHDWIGMTWKGVNTSEVTASQVFVESYCVGNLPFEDNWQNSQTYDDRATEWFSGAGLECTHELHIYQQQGGIIENWISVVYERVPVMIE